ncbi:HAD-IIIC family phosphatase [Candidatus Pelagibacter sp.]|jgi:FkbH-like protein|nr:HAD-IIIC family phosphatase [Candidatus Pelagibacter sp.]
MLKKNLIESINDPHLFQKDLIDIQNLSIRFNKLKRKEFNFKKKIDISISSDYTTNYLVELLPLFLANHKIDCTLSETEFGSLNFLSHDLNNKFWKSKSDLSLLIPSSKNLKYLPKLGDDLKKIKKNAQRDADFWLKIWNNTKKNIIQTTFDPIQETNFGQLDGVKIGGYLHYIRLVNSILIEKLPSNVDLIDIEGLIIKNKNVKWNDNKIYNLTKQPCSMNTLPFLAKNISTLVSGILGLSKKVVILDLDNTLWGGIIGDDGLDGIVLGEETAEGQSFIHFQKYLKNLSNKGIILCVCSKNDVNVAKEVFNKHLHMHLKLKDISLFISNYNNKADNIKKISKTLNLNLDSFVFLDDSKIECELVKNKLPEVMTINLDYDPSEFVENLELILPFYFKKITQEDLDRVNSYEKINLMNNEKSESKNLDDFLKNLKSEVSLEKINNLNKDRSSQLIAKTNQFKLNLKQFSPINLLQKREKCIPISFKDKYQNYGIIGVLVYDINKKLNTLLIDNWVMSCRVFSRRLENYLIEFLINKAKKLDLKYISFNFVLSDKNIYLQNFLNELGFKVSKNNINYSININKIPNNKKHYISSKKAK